MKHITIYSLMIVCFVFTSLLATSCNSDLNSNIKDDPYSGGGSHRQKDGRRPLPGKSLGLSCIKNTAGTASQPYFYLYWMPNPLKESGYSSSSCSSRLLRERLF